MAIGWNDFTYANQQTPGAFSSDNLKSALINAVGARPDGSDFGTKLSEYYNNHPYNSLNGATSAEQLTNEVLDNMGMMNTFGGTAKTQIARLLANANNLAIAGQLTLADRPQAIDDKGDTEARNIADVLSGMLTNGGDPLANLKQQYAQKGYSFTGTGAMWDSLAKLKELYSRPDVQNNQLLRTNIDNAQSAYTAMANALYGSSSANILNNAFRRAATTAPGDNSNPGTSWSRYWETLGNFLKGTGYENQLSNAQQRRNYVL